MQAIREADMPAFRSDLDQIPVYSPGKPIDELARELGLAVHAGHGLTYENVMPVAAIPGCEELNIGHSVVSRSVLVGIERSVREMKELLLRAAGA